MPSENSSKVELWARWLGPAVFLIAFGLRMLGLHWGLPDAQHLGGYHPDEPIVVSVSRSIDLAHGKVDPGFYNYGTFYLTVLNIFSRAAAVYGNADLATPTYVGRLISVVAGSVLTWLVVALLRRNTGVLGAAIGGLSVAFAPALVMHSRFATVDMLATCLGFAGLVAVLRCGPDEPKSMKWAIASGVLVGLSAGTKYTAILALPVILVAIYLATRNAKWTAAAFGCAIAAFIVGTPGMILNPGAFWRDFSYEMAHTSAGHGLVFMATPPGFVMQITNLFAGYGATVTILGIGGLALACGKKLPWAWILAAVALITYVLIGRAEVKFARYAFPLIPLLAVGLGYLAQMAHESKSVTGRMLVAVVMFGVAGFGSGGLLGSATVTSWMNGEDPRDTAGSILKGAASDGSIGVVSDPWFYTAAFSPYVSLPRFVPFEKRQELLASDPPVHVVQYIPAEGPDARLNWDTRLLTERKPDYVTYSSFEWNDVDRIYQAGIERDNPDAEWNRAHAFVEQLKADYELMTVIGQDSPAIHDLAYVHPTIWIWKRKTTSS